MNRLRVDLPKAKYDCPGNEHHFCSVACQGNRPSVGPFRVPICVQPLCDAGHRAAMFDQGECWRSVDFLTGKALCRLGQSWVHQSDILKTLQEMSGFKGHQPPSARNITRSLEEIKPKWWGLECVHLRLFHQTGSRSFLGTNFYLVVRENQQELLGVSPKAQAIAFRV